MNDEERRQWVLNDENLYSWWRAKHIGITTFVKRYRKDLTVMIRRIRDGIVS
jgi:hypothetical protein